MTEPAPEERLWNLLRGATVTRALAVVADLQVAEALAPGPRAVEDVAREVGADADVLYRLLRALASDGVFAEQEHRVFANTDTSDLFLGGGWSDFAHLFGGIWHRTVGELDGAPAEPSFPRLFGTDYWAWLAEHPDERAAFDRAMVQGTERRVERLASLVWSGTETVVDVGGGNGSLLVELVRRYPGLRGIVLDLPETDRDEARLGERIEFVAGDFFESVPAADVYILSGILHDWDGERATAILRTIHAAAQAGSRLLVLESVVVPGNEPDGAKWLDLLLLALLAGRERDEAEWRTLLEGAGFEPVRIQDGLVEAVPVRE